MGQAIHPHSPYRIDFAYDGGPFQGFQRQPGYFTVEDALRSALAPLFPDLKKFSVAGRTDRGVHALHQVISFHSKLHIPNEEIQKALDQVCPNILTTLAVSREHPSFHARFSAISRAYIYQLPKNDFDSKNLPRLRHLLSEIEGTHDFFVFSRSTQGGKSTTRTLTQTRVRETPNAIEFFFQANGFLRRQIRLLVGTALRLVNLKDDEQTLLSCIQSNDRQAAGPLADPEHLYLAEIKFREYPAIPKPRR